MNRYDHWHRVLIDTWWNVNSRAEDIILDKDFVLIDTWWNVNINFSGKMAQMSTGFNRYMVECESDLVPVIV